MTHYPSHIAIGDSEYVETLGLEYDVIEPGLVIEHRPDSPSPGRKPATARRSPAIIPRW